ncbi:vitellogenin isoform X2 [Anabrus simplex]|uniref:vitellogenin isoform X2 n=1 Tax=Anabrus simplex TaxID=316456 RepID=UPI0035A32919
MGEKGKASLLLCLCVGLSAVHGWRPKQEYNFELNGRTVASLPSLGDHATGVHYRGQLRVQSYAADVLFMQIQNLSYIRMQKDMHDGWWGTPHGSDSDYRPMTFSDSTFSVKLRRGLVENLVVTSQLQDWELNFIQGIVSHLQFDLTGSSAKHNSKSNSMHGRGNYESSPYYSIMEEAVSGRCEMRYQINEVPKSIMLANPDWAAREDLCGSRPFIEVTKIRNYSNCDKNPEYHFGLPASPHCHTDNHYCGDLWTRASFSRLIGCGSRQDFMLLASVSTNRMVANLHLHNGTEAAVNSYVNLTLVSAKPQTHRLGLPTSPTRRLQSLTYRYSVPYSQVPEPKPSLTGKPLPDSLEIYSRDDTLENRPRHRSSKNKHSHSQQKRKETRVLNVEASSLDEEAPKLWELPDTGFSRPPHRPFSAFALSHREGDAHSCMNQQFKELITDIAGNLESPKLINEKKTLEKVNLAIEMCRTMMLMDLQKSHAAIMDFSPRDSKLALAEREVLRDIYVMCGTNPAFTIIKSWITQKKIRGEEAAEVIASLPSNLQTPNSDVIYQFYELARHSSVEDDEQVKISAVLAFSNLVRVACVNTRYREARYTMEVLGSPCTVDSAARYIPWLTSQLRTDPGLRRVFLAALGNTAHPTALPVLKSMVEDSNLTPYLRSVAVFSMRYYISSDPYGMSEMLLAMFHNYSNPVPVRMAALSMLMYSKPGLSTWQQIAISTWYEPSPAIVSYIWSSLSSMSGAQDSLYQQMFESAKSVLPLAKPVSLASHLPQNFMWSSVRKDIGSIILEQLCFSNDVEASHIYLRDTRRLGSITTIIRQAEIWAANPDALMQLMVEFMNPKEDLKLVRPPLSNVPHPTRWIHEELKIAARTLPRLEGDLHFTLNNLKERIFPFDNQSVDAFLKAGGKTVEQMKSGKDYHYQKMDQDGIIIETTNEMGFPISLRVKSLSAFQFSGEAKLSSDHMNLDANFNVMYATQLMAELTAFHQWDDMEFMAASYTSTVINLPPLNLKTNINKTESQVQMQIQFESPTEDVNLVSHHSTPFIAQRNIFNLNPITLAKDTYFFPITDQRQLITLPHVAVTYASSGEPETFMEWLKSDISLYKSSMMWETLQPAYFEMDLIELAPLQINFTIATAEMRDGQFIFKMLANMSAQSDHNQTTETPVESSLVPLENTSTSSTSMSTSTESTTVVSTTEGSEDSATPELTKPEEEQGSEGENVDKIIIDNMEQKSYSEFNATTVDPFDTDVQGNYFSYLLNHILSGMNNGEAVTVGVNFTTMSDNPEKYEGIIAWGHALGGNTKRAAFYLRDKQMDWMIGVSGDVYLIPAPLLDLRQILNHNMSAKFSADLINRLNGSASIASLKGSVTRSKEQGEELRSSRDIQQCLQDIAASGSSAHVHKNCRNAAKLAAFNDHISVRITLKPDENHRYRFGWANETITAVMKLWSNADTANLWIRTPSREVEYTGIGIPITMSTVLLRLNTEYSPMEQVLGTGSCGVTPDNVTTYDGVHFTYHMGSCWHVLTKDCSGKSRIVVLGRTEKNVTMAEINVDNYKIISLLPELRIAINQKPVTLTPMQVTELRDLSGTTIAQISTSPDRTIKIRLPEHDMTVLYANSSVLISAGFGSRSRLCGLCGDNDGELVDDLKTPRGVVEHSPQEFALSYVLHEDECQEGRMQTTVRSKIKHYRSCNLR